MKALSDSHIIKLLFWGIQFKLGLGGALVGEIELLCLRIFFDSGDSGKELSRNQKKKKPTSDLTRTGGSVLMVCL